MDLYSSVTSFIHIIKPSLALSSQLVFNSCYGHDWSDLAVAVAAAAQMQPNGICLCLLTPQIIGIEKKNKTSKTSSLVACVFSDKIYIFTKCSPTYHIYAKSWFVRFTSSFVSQNNLCIYERIVCPHTIDNMIHLIICTIIHIIW